MKRFGEHDKAVKMCEKEKDFFPFRIRSGAQRKAVTISVMKKKGWRLEWLVKHATQDQGSKERCFRSEEKKGKQDVNERNPRRGKSERDVVREENLI